MYKKYKVKTITENELPEKLREIPDRPKQLNIKGDFTIKGKLLCVVGARKHSDYGKEVCEKIIAGLAGHNITIISGLALGIDSIAHKSALEAGLKTIAFPGSGLSEDVLYPRTNIKLAEKILDAGGAIVSEFEDDFVATPYSFPQRNRLMAGISDAVLVIEAEIKSGTLITSKLATEYNRDVFTIPGNIFSKLSEGPNMLLRLGATPIRNSDDVLEALGLKSDDEPKNLELKYADCSSEELFIIDILKSPLPKDELIRASKMPISKINMILSVMELKGLIKENMGEVHLT